MLLQRIVFGAVALVLAGAIGVAILDSGKPPPPEHGGETADRLSDARMEKMVAGPMALVAKNDMAAAGRLFESDLARARAKGGLHAGDLLTAYGVELWKSDHTATSTPYFRRAVDAYRQAAPGSPELALALMSYADIICDVDTETCPREALAALDEALQIRLRTLGPANAETAVTYVRLGRVQGLPAISGQDPVRVAAAAELIRTGLRLLPTSPNADPADEANARLDLAKVYARNGDVPATFKAAGDYMSASHGDGADRLRGVAEIFEKAGDPASGERLRRTFAIPDAPADDKTPALK